MTYQLTITSAPAAEPVSAADVRTHMRIGYTDHDTYIGTLITAARTEVEHFLNRGLITQTVKVYFENWPFDDDAFYLPWGNVQSVTSVVYKDENGDSNTWSSDDYDTELDTVPAVIRLGIDEDWPEYDLHTSQPIAITYVAGFGDAGTDVPEDIKLAIKLLVKAYYDDLPTKGLWSGSVGALLWKYKVNL